MSQLKPGTDEYNRAVNKIADLNLIVSNFLDKFESFRKDYNITDKNLNHNLQSIIDVIDNFVDHDPKDIDSHEKTKINLNYLHENTISNVYVCNTCDEEVGHRYKDIQRHLLLSTHIKNFQKKPIANNNASKIDVKQQKPSSSSSINKLSNKENNPQQMGHQHQQLPPQSLQNGIKESQLTRKEKRLLKKELGKQRKSNRKDNVEKENLPKRAKTFISSDFSKFLRDSAVLGNKLKFIPAYDEIAKSLLNAISPIYPDAKYHFFGSRTSGLGANHSDLDIFLNIGNVFNLYGEPQSKIVDKLSKVYDILSKRPMEWHQFVKVKTARVPVLKVLNKKQYIDCDIAFSNGLGPCNTILMKYYFELQPLCHKMCLFMKEWLTLTTLKSHFTTYTMTLMVVFYLQTKSILPPVKDLQEEIQNPLMIGPWQGNIVEKQLRDLRLTKCDDSYESVKQYLCGFFNFYKNYDYNTNVICPYLGISIKKEWFNTIKNPMTRYFEYYQLNRDQNGFQIDKIMCVQDPLEQNHNVAKAVTEGFLKRLRHYFNLSSQELKWE